MKQEIILKCLSETTRTPMEELQTIDLDLSLTEIGMTSLSFISFIVQLEQELNIEVLDSDLIFENFSTLRKLYKTLSKYLSNEEIPIKKVLVLDADNVLWKGISGEEPLIIDNAVKKLQSLLLSFYERGVLLCLCSKNQTELIEEAFLMPQMQLKKEHFAVFLANRQDKASNLQTIASELNLSTDSFVFVDDSDYELGFIGLNFPEVECVKVDYSAGDSFYQTLSKLFSGVQATSGLNRTQLYREQKEREKEKHRFTSVQKYNASLQTETLCHCATEEECERLAELSIRTHQFNLSGKQYAQDELKAMIVNPDYTVLSLSVKDKYGDMGIVGMAVIRQTTIEAFMLSCRVFDRDLEYVLLNEIKARVDAPLCGVYIPTNKNQAVANFYESHGVEVL